jgi:hypothetical protein
VLDYRFRGAQRDKPPRNPELAITACLVTTPETATPPDDPNADPFGAGPWFINADQTIWADWGPGWAAGKSATNKVIWLRPAQTDLVLSGQRLDGESLPMEASIPCCYNTGFQVTGLYFPTGGCWEVTATAGESQLQFVVEIAPNAGETP